MSQKKIHAKWDPKKKYSCKLRAHYFTKTRRSPCLPEIFLARKEFISSGSGSRSFGFWPTRKIPAARKKKTSGTQGSRMTSFGERGKTSAWTREDKTKLETD